MSKNTLRICYELDTEIFSREFVAEILNRSKLWSRSLDWPYELQELTTIYKIQLRTSRIDNESATNPKMY